MRPSSKLHRIPVQKTTDDLIIEGPIISATCTETETSTEKKQKEAEKPLYLKRV